MAEATPTIADSVAALRNLVFRADNCDESCAVMKQVCLYLPNTGALHSRCSDSLEAATGGLAPAADLFGGTGAFRSSFLGPDLTAAKSLSAPPSSVGCST